MPAEAIGKKRVEVDLLLTHETASRQLPRHEKVEHRADAGRRGDLNRAPVLTADVVVIDLAAVGDLHQLTVPPSDHRTEGHDDILEGDRYRDLEDVFEHLPALAQPQLV